MRSDRPRRRRSDRWDVLFRCGASFVCWWLYLTVLWEPPDEPTWLDVLGGVGAVAMTVGALGTAVSWQDWHDQHRLWKHRDPPR